MSQPPKSTIFAPSARWVSLSMVFCVMAGAVLFERRALSHAGNKTVPWTIQYDESPARRQETAMNTIDSNPLLPREDAHDPTRRKALSCLAAWTGAAVVWSVAGGVP